MNRINPLYVALLLVITLGVVIWQDRKFTEAIQSKAENLAQLEKVGQKVAALRDYWKDPKKQRQRVQEFIRFASRFIKKKEQRGNRLKLRLEGVDARSADQLVDKLLNSFLRVDRVKIERKDKNHITMEVELML